MELSILYSDISWRFLFYDGTS